MRTVDNEEIAERRNILRPACWFSRCSVSSLFSQVKARARLTVSPAEATIQNIHDAYKAGRLTAHQLVQLYLNRIEAYDKKGPPLNTISTINPHALEEADRLDAVSKPLG